MDRHNPNNLGFDKKNEESNEQNRIEAEAKINILIEKISDLCEQLSAIMQSEEFKIFPIEFKKRVLAAQERFSKDCVSIELPVFDANSVKWSLVEKQESIRQIEEIIKDYNDQLPEMIKLNERQRRGECVVNFGGSSYKHRYWVIRSDGSYRQADSEEYIGSRHKGIKDMRWRIVETEELAVGLSLEKHSSIPWVADKINILTQAQKSAIKNLEIELGLKAGSFGLNEEANNQAEEMIKDVLQKCKEFTGPFAVFRDIEIDPQRITMWSGEGVVDIGGFEYDFFGTIINHSSPFNERCNGRDAQKVKTVGIDKNFELVVLVYHKYGHWQAGLRLQRTADKSSTQKQPESVAQVSVDDLKRKFGN